MKAGFSKLFISFIVLSLIFSVYFTAKSYGISDNTVNKIEAEYKNVYSITAYFYQKEIMPGYSQNMAFRGRFYYQRNKGMAWVYEYPFHKRQVLKNAKLYIISNNRIKKVTVVNVGKEKGGFPPNVVKVIGSLTKYFRVENISKNSVSGEIVLELKPIAMQRAKKIYVGFAEKNLKIKSLKIITHQGQIIDFKYKNVKFNGSINGNIFNIH